MHIPGSYAASKPVTLFSGQSNLKLGPWPVEVEDVPKEIVAEGIDFFESKSPFRSRIADLPQDMSLKILYDDKVGGDIVETKGLSVEDGGAAHIRWRTPAGVARAFGDLINFLHAKQ